LSATPNLPEETYNWEYSIDGLKWSPIPGAYGKADISFTSRELLGNQSQQSDLDGKRIIFFRVESARGEKPVVKARLIFIPPRIVSITPISGKCLSTSNSLNIQFDRPLGDKEILYLSLIGKTIGHTNAFDTYAKHRYIRDVKELDANNTFVLDELASDDYELKVFRYGSWSEEKRSINIFCSR